MNKLVAIPIGDSTYVVIKKKKIVRSARVCGAAEAYRVLKPKANESIYIKVK